MSEEKRNLTYNIEIQFGKDQIKEVLEDSKVEVSEEELEHIYRVFGNQNMSGRIILEMTNTCLTVFNKTCIELIALLRTMEEEKKKNIIVVEGEY